MLKPQDAEKLKAETFTHAKKRKQKPRREPKRSVEHLPKLPRNSECTGPQSKRSGSPKANVQKATALRVMMFGLTSHLHR